MMRRELEKKRSKCPLLISGCLPPPMGGMATYYQTLIESSLSEQIQYQFVQTSSNRREFSKSGRASLSNFIYAAQDCIRFTAAVWRNKPEIAHIGTAYGISFLKHSFCVLIAYLLGCKVLLHPHCSFITIYINQTKLWQWFFRQVMRMTKGVIVLSKEWLQLGVIIPKCRVFYMPNPINIQRYRSVLEKKTFANPRQEKVRILFLGYLGKAKGSFDIIDAANIIRSKGENVIFDLVGGELSPGELNLLQEKIRSENLDGLVILNPPAYGDDKLNYFQKADIFIYPSYHEGVPMAVLEAMACGLPIIASRVGGLPDVVKDGENGILIEAGHPEQLANAVCYLVEKPEVLLQMGKASYQLASENYSIEQHVYQLIHIYEEMMDL